MRIKLNPVFALIGLRTTRTTHPGAPFSKVLVTIRERNQIFKSKFKELNEVQANNPVHFVLLTDSYYIIYLQTIKNSTLNYLSFIVIYQNFPEAGPKVEKVKQTFLTILFPEIYRLSSSWRGHGS